MKQSLTLTEAADRLHTSTRRVEDLVDGGVLAEGVGESEVATDAASIECFVTTKAAWSEFRPALVERVMSVTGHGPSPSFNSDELLEELEGESDLLKVRQWAVA